MTSRRRFPRIECLLPIEVVDPAGTFLIRARIQEITPVSLRVRFFRETRLLKGDRVTLTIQGSDTKTARTQFFQGDARVLRLQGRHQVVLTFETLHSEVALRFRQAVYEPLMSAILLFREQLGRAPLPAAGEAGPAEPTPQAAPLPVHAEHADPDYVRPSERRR